jgi:hypothetical protein
MSKKTTAVAPKITHEATVRRLGPGVYRAEDLELGAEIGCGWVGPVREGHWWEARKVAEADADAHSGRDPKPAAKGPTPSRPVRIADDLWNGVLAVSVAEGVTASEVLRRSIAAYPPVAEAIGELEQVSA